jgi:hypothetical protein
MQNAFKLAAVTLAVGLMGAAASSAMASPTPATTWQKDHPRRVQVNSRLNNQNSRIHAGVKDGDLTKAQAGALHKDDRQIRTEERLMASQNGTHITTQEQKTLNRQENTVSKEIGK